MFCKNCSKELLENETVCSQCNAPKGEGINYCSNCGTYTPPNQAFCTRCGEACQTQQTTPVNPMPVYTQPPVMQPPVAQERKSRLAVGLLALVFGSLGIHNFYLGQKSRAYAQLILTLVSLFTCGITAIVSMVWAFVEAIQIFSGTINHDVWGNEFKS